MSVQYATEVVIMFAQLLCQTYHHVILQVFQPLLLEYFTQQELRSIKQIVLELHNLPEFDQSGVIILLLFTNYNILILITRNNC